MSFAGPYTVIWEPIYVDKSQKDVAHFWRIITEILLDDEKQEQAEA